MNYFSNFLHQLALKLAMGHFPFTLILKYSVHPNEKPFSHMYLILTDKYISLQSEMAMCTLPCLYDHGLLHNTRAALPQNSVHFPTPKARLSFHPTSQRIVQYQITKVIRNRKSGKWIGYSTRQH